MKENKKLEYKQEVNDSFLKTVSAFANYEGGEIIFGISDNGEVLGLKDVDRLCLSLENKINDSIKPNPDYTISVNQKNNTITLRVNSGITPPYYYRKKAYKRNDTSTIEVDTIELNRLILRGEHLNFEELKSDNQDLTFHYLEKRLCDALDLKMFSDDILKTLNLYDKNNGFNKAALLLSDQNDMRGIDVARFGDSINIFMDRETFEGCSVLEAYDESIEMFEQYFSYEEVIGAERQKFYTVPIEAYREALANAVVHRTWDIDARIRVSMFKDRIEITSPGGLPYGLSEEEYLNGQVSIFRNPILSNVFFRLKIIETFGTGIIKIRQAYEKIDQKPQFNIFENSITVILPTKNCKCPVTADEQKIIDYLSSGRLSSSSEIANEIGFSKAKTVQLLNSLVEKRSIVSEGNGRGKKYRTTYKDGIRGGNDELRL